MEEGEVDQLSCECPCEYSAHPTEEGEVDQLTRVSMQMAHPRHRGSSYKDLTSRLETVRHLLFSSVVSSKIARGTKPEHKTVRMSVKTSILTGKIWKFLIF